MVISPGFGLGLSIGTYCLTDSHKVSSCSVAIARGYSLICWQGERCSITQNGPDIIVSIP
ncbi:hypothetical protein I7I53_07909 [Histoplasma capsulatum var. duboisii H88]|uniref:Uncharacterized protein n=1 Tax=Ajellomyces capsulatus (strain H88) TaxID=544711 RepID=A0A8A1LFI6_AJEC8|nr:hypothetical protein I7I53_07909 [Histoplasma capsulatum var. duboisii H88]